VELARDAARVAPEHLELAELDRAAERRFEAEHEACAHAALHALELGRAHRSFREGVELGVERALDLGELRLFGEHDLHAELIRTAEIACPGAGFEANRALSYQR